MKALATSSFIGNSMNSSEVSHHVVTAIEKAGVSLDPFPFFYAENVFPEDTYAQIQEYLDKKSDFEETKFKNRKISPISKDLPAIDFLFKGDFLRSMIAIFNEQLKQRYGGKTVKFFPDVRFIQDSFNYKIGPHTDSVAKVLSLLFYLPKTAKYSSRGTSMFVPKDSSFTCLGGPHYPFENFDEVGRAPYLPNSCFGFWKTDKSFHGVTPVTEPICRNVLLYNVYDVALRQNTGEM